MVDRTPTPSNAIRINGSWVTMYPDAYRGYDRHPSGRWHLKLVPIPEKDQLRIEQATEAEHKQLRRVERGLVTGYRTFMLPTERHIQTGKFSVSSTGELCIFTTIGKIIQQAHLPRGLYLPVEGELNTWQYQPPQPKVPKVPKPAEVLATVRFTATPSIQNIHSQPGDLFLEGEVIGYDENRTSAKVRVTSHDIANPGCKQGYWKVPVRKLVYITGYKPRPILSG